MTTALLDDWWTADDCARIFGISVATWRAYVSRGQAPLGRTPLRTFARLAIRDNQSMGIQSTRIGPMEFGSFASVTNAN
jgi:hypothetical protein